MGLDAETRRQNKEWDRSHPRKPTPHYHTPEELAPSKLPDTSMTDRFTTRFVLDGKEVDILILPEGSSKSYPRLFGINIGSSHFGWIIIDQGEWKWFSNEHPQHLADEIANVIIAKYQ